MTGNSTSTENKKHNYINRTQMTQQEPGQGIATSTEHKTQSRTYDSELLHQQNTNNTTRTWSGNCYINRTQKNTIRTMTGNCYINRTQKNTTRTWSGNCYINRTQKTQ